MGWVNSRRIGPGNDTPDNTPEFSSVTMVDPTIGEIVRCAKRTDYRVLDPLETRSELQALPATSGMHLRDCIFTFRTDDGADGVEGRNKAIITAAARLLHSLGWPKSSVSAVWGDVVLRAADKHRTEWVMSFSVWRQKS